MARSKAERPALAFANGQAAEFVPPGRTNSFDANLNLPKIQAAHLARRFGLAPHLAAIVAEAAFGSAVSQ